MGLDVFFLSPIGDDGSPERDRADDVYMGIVEPACEARKLVAKRADHFDEPGRITRQVVEAIIEAKAVVADLTGRNANVYYELGIAHSFTRPTVLIADRASSLVFDVKDERTIMVGDNGRIGIADAKTASVKLGEALDLALAESFRPSSLVTEVAGSQSLDLLAEDDPVAAELASIRETLESVHQATSTFGDYLYTRKWIEESVDSWTINIQRLKSDWTTSSHDDWADGLIERRRKRGGGVRVCRGRGTLLTCTCQFGSVGESADSGAHTTQVLRPPLRQIEQAITVLSRTEPPTSGRGSSQHLQVSGCARSGT